MIDADFYNRWMQKAAGYNQDFAADVIDSYTSYFIVYNALYESGNDLLKPERKFNGDHSKAVNVIQQFAVENLIAIISSPKIVKQIKILSEVIISHFKICFRNGIYSFEDDENLKKLLQSENSNEKLNSILEALYQIRCNIFHGRKDVQLYQRLLLKPCIKILKLFNEHLYSEIQMVEIFN